MTIKRNIATIVCVGQDPEVETVPQCYAIQNGDGSYVLTDEGDSVLFFDADRFAFCVEYIMDRPEYTGLKAGGYIVSRRQMKRMDYRFLISSVFRAAVLKFNEDKERKDWRAMTWQLEPLK